MAEEDLRYKVVLDASELPSALEQVKSQINGALAGSIGPGMSAGGMMPQAGAAMPMADMQASSPSFSSWAQNTADSMKMGYYKTEELATTANLMRKQAAMQITDYFNQQKSPVSSMDPIQLATASLGIGYDPYMNMQSKGEVMQEVNQRIADNQTLGMMDYGFGDMVLGGASAGAMVGGMFGVKGALIGGGIGATVGTMGWIANEVMSPFASEASFRRNISRGLKDYSKYSVMGRTSYEDRNEVAEMLADFDTSAEMVGTGTDRDDVKAMFDIGVGTNYMNTSSNMSEFKDKMKKFMTSYTKIQHIIGKTGADIGAFVDQMHESGLLDQFDGDMVGAATYVRGAGMGARLGVDQAMQVYSSGAEMVRGTGIDMGAGGSLLLNNLADTVNMLKNKDLSQQDIAQLGGTQSAAAVLTRNAFETAVSPTGQALGFAMMDGNYAPGMNLSEAYMGGVSGVGGYSDYVKKMVEYNKYLGEGGADTMQMVDMSAKINLLKDANIIKDNMNFDEIAFVVSNQSKSLFGRQMSVPEARLMLANSTRSEEAIMAPFQEEIISLQQTTQGEKSSWFSRASDNIGNFFTDIWKGIGSWIDPGNTEITPSWVGNNSGVTIQSDIDAFNPYKKINKDIDEASADLDKRYSRLSDAEKSEYKKVESEVTSDNYLDLLKVYEGNPKAQEYVKMAVNKKGMMKKGEVDNNKKYTILDVVSDVNEQKWKTFVQKGENPYFLANPATTTLQEMAENLGFDIKGMSGDAESALEKHFLGSEDIGKSISRFNSMLEVFSSPDVKAAPPTAGEGRSIVELKKKYEKIEDTDEKMAEFVKDFENYSPVVMATILKGDKDLSKEFATKKIGMKSYMDEHFKSEVYNKVEMKKETPSNTGFSNFTGEAYDISGDKKFNSEDVYKWNTLTPEAKEKLLKEKGWSADSDMAKFLKGTEDEMQATVRLKNSQGVILRQKWDESRNEILSEARSKFGEDSNEYRQYVDALTLSKGEILDMDRTHETVTNLAGFEKLKLSSSNIIKMDTAGRESMALTLATGGSQQQAELMAKKADNLAEQVKISSQLRTQIAPDGSITQSRDTEQLQVTMADSLSSLVKLGTGQLNVARAVLIATIDKNVGVTLGEEEKNEVRTVLGTKLG